MPAPTSTISSWLVAELRRGATLMWQRTRFRAPGRGCAGAGLSEPGVASLVQSTPGLGAAAAARARWVAGCALAACGKDAEARAQFEASLAHAREVGDRHCECRSLIELAARENAGGHMDTARAHLQAALAAASDIEDRTLQSDARKELGNMEVMLGRSNEAQAQFEQARALAREAGDRELRASFLPIWAFFTSTPEEWTRPGPMTKPRLPWHWSLGIGSLRATYDPTSACCTRCRVDSMKLLNNCRRRLLWLETWATSVSRASAVQPWNGLRWIGPFR